MVHDLEMPSSWVRRWAALVPHDARGAVLDLACGRGRHARYFASLGHTVIALDRDREALAALAGVPRVQTLCADIEGAAWPLQGRRFTGVVVCNYLHRPLLPVIADSLETGGVLIYETFAAGNERYGRPSNPDFLLRPGELLEAFGSALTVIAFEQGLVNSPKPAVVQRICAARSPAGPLAIDASHA
jgi:SAM-dependent methyltransferase